MKNNIILVAIFCLFTITVSAQEKNSVSQKDSVDLISDIATLVAGNSNDKMWTRVKEVNVGGQKRHIILPVERVGAVARFAVGGVKNGFSSELAIGYNFCHSTVELIGGVRQMQFDGTDKGLSKYGGAVYQLNIGNIIDVRKPVRPFIFAGVLYNNCEILRDRATGENMTENTTKQDILMLRVNNFGFHGGAGIEVRLDKDNHWQLGARVEYTQHKATLYNMEDSKYSSLGAKVSLTYRIDNNFWRKSKKSKK